MWNLRLFPVALAAVAVIAIAGGVVTAQTGENESKTFTGRVASILNVDEQAVQDAMKQAKQEIVQEKLEKAVETGKITQEQADARLVSLQATPEEKKALRIKRFQAALDKAVEAGKSTQDKADEKLEGYLAKPVGKRHYGNHWVGKHGHRKHGQK